MRVPVVVPVLLAMLLALVCGPPARADDQPPAGIPTRSVTGVVRDEQGRPLAGVEVRVHSYAFVTDTGPRDWTSWARTDADGAFAFGGVAAPADRWQSYGSDLHVETPGYAPTNYPDFATALGASPADRPFRADVVLVREDVTLSGRLTVRGGAAPTGGRVTAVATEVDLHRNPGNVPDRWGAVVAEDGTWTMKLPPVPVRLEASSTYGVETGYPDLPSVRRDSPVITGVHGEVRTGLDFSLRARLPFQALDEFGEYHAGVDSTGAYDPAPAARYPRDTYRSVTSVVGPRISAGPVHNDPSSPLGVPANDPVTITGMPIPVHVTITNPGDDVLWLGDVRFEGPASVACAVTDMPTDCRDAFVLPGTSRTFALTVDSTHWSAVYRATLVVPSNAPGGDLRVPIAVRNLATADFDPNDPSHPLPLGLLPYLTPQQLALAIANGNLSAPLAHALGVRALSVGRSRVAVTFPAAGTATVEIARALAVRARSAVRWRTVRRLRIVSARAGRATRAIRPLAAGRYRLRVTTRIAGHRPRTTATYRTVPAAG